MTMSQQKIDENFEIVMKQNTHKHLRRKKGYG